LILTHLCTLLTLVSTNKGNKSYKLVNIAPNAIKVMFNASLTGHVFCGSHINPNLIANATIKITQPLIKPSQFGACGASHMQAAKIRSCSLVISSPSSMSMCTHLSHNPNPNTSDNVHLSLLAVQVQTSF
jgi:hypothetical protein